MWFVRPPVLLFTTEFNSSLDKPPMNFNGLLPKLVLAYLVKQTISFKSHIAIIVVTSPGWVYIHLCRRAKVVLIPVGLHVRVSVLFACLLATLQTNDSTNFQEIVRICPAWNTKHSSRILCDKSASRMVRLCHILQSRRGGGLCAECFM